MTTYTAGSSGIGRSLEECSSADHLHHRQHDDQQQQEEEGCARPSTANKPLRKGRNQMLLSALALCALGLLCEMQSLQEFSPLSDDQMKHKNNNLRLLENDHHHHLKGDLYIPSIEYRIEGESVYSSSTNTRSSMEKIDCSRAVKDLEWEWFNNNHEQHQQHQHQGTSKTRRDGRNDKNQPKPRLLIALSSGYDKSAELLTRSAHLAKVYAKQYDATVVVLQGMAFAPHGCTPPASHASLNKIRLLFHAIDHNDQFDQILLLDADALMVNMEVDVTDLIDDAKTTLLAAQPVRSGDSQEPHPPPHKVNTGVTLWNLQHPDIKAVAIQWFQGAKKAVLKGMYHGDQRYLQTALEEYDGTKTNVRLLQQEFAYAEGTVVQHFLQHSKKMSWNDRKAKVQHAFDQVCQHKDYAKECAAIPQSQYATQ